MLKNVNAYLVFSSTQKATKSECCSIVAEKTIEEHPDGLATPNCVFSPLKDFASHNVSNAKTCFLTLGCIDESKCLCCVDIDYKHDLDTETLKQQKKRFLEVLCKPDFYIETTKNGLHLFFLMPVECHFGDNEHPSNARCFLLSQRLLSVFIIYELDRFWQVVNWLLLYQDFVLPLTKDERTHENY